MNHDFVSVTNVEKKGLTRYSKIFMSNLVSIIGELSTLEDGYPKEIPQQFCV